MTRVIPENWRPMSGRVHKGTVGLVCHLMGINVKCVEIDGVLRSRVLDQELDTVAYGAVPPKGKDPLLFFRGCSHNESARRNEYHFGGLASCSADIVPRNDQ